MKPVVRPPIAIMGVPFDNVTKQEALALIEKMLASRQPHYLVTANVDFLVQARSDVELHRILADAHLVLCDGTPLVWASRILGNRLPERVAGADLVPLLIRMAAEKGYRLFLLGATPDSAAKAVRKLRARHPSLVIAGHYSPPFRQLLEMDHEEIRRRVIEAQADILLVSFGCPKQEKWMWMHYRSLPVPVTVGVGATIDFLAGQVRRAPCWMQKTGTEWVFRLAQEPRRLFRRYMKDFWVFGWAIFWQLWNLQWRKARRVALSRDNLKYQPEVELPHSPDLEPGAPTETFHLVTAGEELDVAHVTGNSGFWDRLAVDGRDCILSMDRVRAMDSTGIGQLVRTQKKLKTAGRRLILLAPSSPVLRCLELMHLAGYFHVAPDVSSARSILLALREGPAKFPASIAAPMNTVLQWSGEILATNVEFFWAQINEWLLKLPGTGLAVIDLANVRFIDSSGLGLMIRIKKLAAQQERTVQFTGVQPPVLNVLRIAHLEKLLLAP